MSSAALPDADVILILRGKSVALGPLRRDLTTLYQRWMNDLRVTRTLAAPSLPVSVEAETTWVDQALLGSDPIFTIYEEATLRPIGTVGLHDIKCEHGTAEFGLLIGATDVWGRGFGTEVTSLMLSYAFDVLGLHSVQLVVYANNPGALRAYERAGFRRSGDRREALKVGRRRYDAIYMDALASEFAPSAAHDILHPPPRSGLD